MNKLLAFPGCSARLQLFEREIINTGVKSYEYIWQISLTKMGYDMRYNPAFETITSDRFPGFVEGFRVAVAKYNEMLKSYIHCKSSDYTHSNPAILVTKLLPQMIKKYAHSDELIEYQPKCISMRMTSSTNNTFSVDYNITEAEELINELEKVPQMVDLMIKKMILLRAEFPDD